jgi:hypothetical protein
LASKDIPVRIWYVKNFRGFDNISKRAKKKSN